MWEAFLQSCSDDIRQGCVDDKDARARLRRVLERAKAAWPDLEISPTSLARKLGRSLTLQPARLLDDLPIEDLALATSCGDADDAAIRTFERAYFPDLRGVLRRYGYDIDEPEFRQQIRMHLFVAQDGVAPRIDGYVGRGELRNWFRVMVLRQALNRVRDHRVDPRTKHEELTEQLAPIVLGSDYDLTKAAYARALNDAFAASVADLQPRQKLLLRYQAIDGYSLVAIGKLVGTHRSTAARWLREAKEALLLHTRARLADDLGTSDSEAKAIIQLAISRVDVTLRRVLATSTMED